MKRTQLWSVTKDGKGKLTAKTVEAMGSTETEKRLEELLVSSPALLANDMYLVSRQLPVGADFLDLLGVDQDGRLVIYEIKKEKLTRSAVSQVLDYASFLGALENKDLARLIDGNAGQHGIDKITDFLDWYDKQFPGSRDTLSKPPRMVLVGLGVDDRARRIVDFMASFGLDIQLLVFHAFKEGDRVFFARQVESALSDKKQAASSGYTKDGNKRLLLATARSYKVEGFLDKVAQFVNAALGGYQWPGKTAYSFSLEDRTSEDKPTLHSYVAIYLNSAKPNTLLLQLTPRAKEIAEDAIKRFCAAVPRAEANKTSWVILELELSEQNWPTDSPHIKDLVQSIKAKWEEKRKASDSSTGDETSKNAAK